MYINLTRNIRTISKITSRGSREKEGTLALPVIGGDETGYDGWSRAGCAVLPVGEGLVAEHPVPLSVDGVGDGDVGE